MKSKISCWRLVRSMSGLPGGLRRAERTCVREGSGGPGRNQPGAILASVRGSRRGPTCAGGGIGRRARLRALWAEWPVEVRVLFGALEKPRISRGFVRVGSQRDADGALRAVGCRPARRCRRFQRLPTGVGACGGFVFEERQCYVDRWAVGELLAQGARAG